MSTNRLNERELDRQIAETQESHIASVRRQWYEVQPEPERHQPAKYSGVFFDDPLADWAAIAALSFAAGALVAVSPGQGAW